MTPQEAWSGAKPTISHLRVFGSIAYAHVADELTTKLDDKSKKYVFVGYDARSNGYKLYNPVNGKMIISHDVEFDEESLWNWSNSHEDYNVFPFVDEEDNEENLEQQLATPPTS